jgi:DNA-binding transcriptional ArsR family regulator
MADEVFLALANPVRRRLLTLLAERGREWTAGALALEFRGGEHPLSRPSVAEHLGVLKRAGLVRDTPEGRRRVYELNAEPLAEIADWLAPFEGYWRRTLRDLAEFVENEEEA